MSDDARSASSPSPDESGFRDWMVHRVPSLRRKAYLLCGDWASADDLVQEVLVAMYSGWARIARGGNVDAYASKVLVGKHIDARRRPWRREQPVVDVPDSIDVAADRALAAVDNWNGPLSAALASLPRDQRAILVLRFADDMAVAEIARVLGLPEGTVKSRLSRGTERLRAALGLSAVRPRIPLPDPAPGFAPILEERT